MAMDPVDALGNRTTVDQITVVAKLFNMLNL